MIVVHISPIQQYQMKLKMDEIKEFDNSNL